MTKLIIILLTSQAEFTVSNKLNLIYLPLLEQNNCFQAIDDIREDIAIYDDKSNRWLLKNGNQFIGGFCEWTLQIYLKKILYLYLWLLQ